MTILLLFLKIILITVSTVASMIIFYHISVFFQLKTSEIYLTNKDIKKGNRIFTIIFSLFPIFIWSIILQMNTTQHLHPLLRGIVFGLIIAILYLLGEKSMIKVFHKDNDNYFKNFLLYLIHSCIAFPLLGIIAAISYKKILVNYPLVKTYSFIVILGVLFLIYFLINEIRYQIYKNKANIPENHISIENLNFEGLYKAVFPNNVEKEILLKQTENGLNVIIKEQDLKLKGFENNGKIFADLSNELPSITLYFIGNNNFSGTVRNKINGKKVSSSVLLTKK